MPQNKPVPLRPVQSTATVGFQPSWQLHRIPVAQRSAESAAFCWTLLSQNSNTDGQQRAFRLHELFERRCEQFGSHVAEQVAIDYGAVNYTYAGLLDRSRQLARHLQAQGVCAGDRVALLLDRSLDLYASVLACSMLDATYIPLDASFPAPRISYICDDAKVTFIVSLHGLSQRLPQLDVPILLLDTCHMAIDAQRADAIDVASAREVDPLAYVIYTSGSTGRPKGVAVRQSNICNFLDIAARHYGFQTDDRVFQSLTIAFDYSFEEIWVPLLAGATLVPAPSGVRLVGSELADHLAEQDVTAWCCVPTILRTVSASLPRLRLLMVSGEECPADVIAPWCTSGRRVLNVYGPTETTVTATWSVVNAGDPITIGGPLPSYAIVILDPDTGSPVDAGQIGEICVGGIGVADGYLNRPEQTTAAFIPDFIGLPENPRGMIYRTGDLGRFTENNTIEYRGRIDTQVKIRGYRIELGEIEAVARSIESVGNVVVQPVDPDGKGTVLAAYLTPKASGISIDIGAVDSVIRKALPSYMVPHYYETLITLPMLPSDKVDRKALPAPTSARAVAADTEYVAPATSLESTLIRLMAETMQIENVSTTADFFDHLGADSLKLAALVTAIRKDTGIRRVSMRSLYTHTTVQALAEHLHGLSANKPNKSNAVTVASMSEYRNRDTESVSEPAVSTTQRSTATKSEAPVRVSNAHADSPHRPTRRAQILTGMGQMLFSASLAFIFVLLGVEIYHWIVDAPDAWIRYSRILVGANLLFFGSAAAMIAIKWLAVGRFTTTPIPIWSWAYFRFWVARSAIQANPLNLFIGTPVYSWFLRSVGVRVGRDTLILTRAPACTDLIVIGKRVSIRQVVALSGYSARNGYLYPGTIQIDDDVLICEASVLDINTRVGANSQLGACTLVEEGQILSPDGCYQGVPAEVCNTRVDSGVKPATSRYSTPLRAFTFALSHLLAHCLFSLPAGIGLVFLIVVVGISTAGLTTAPTLLAGTLLVLVASGIVYLSGLLISMGLTLTVPRLINRFIIPDKVHPIYGVQYELVRALARWSNNRAINMIFGDSSMILYWLSAVGYDLRKSTQTGSNFGVEQRHHSPFLCSFDRNTLVSDGLFMLNMQSFNSGFRLRQVAMPPDTYIGNDVHYPADARIGDNCLIATKAAVPTSGAVRSDVGILGSPAFEIPRSVAPGILEQCLARKLRSNVLTLVLYLLRSWALIAIGLGLAILALSLIGTQSPFQIAAAVTVAFLAFAFIAPLFVILSERLVFRFRKLEPLYCSLYDPRFWAHERFWKLNYNPFLIVFNGTPMKAFFLRMQGVKVGKRLFDDGGGIPEPTLVSIGDDCMLNSGSALQCHSLEDGTFKSDRIRLGDRCTIGVHGFVHYGSTLHDDTWLDAHTFLMKGSVMESGTHWVGNPARDATQTDLSIPAVGGIKRW